LRSRPGHGKQLDRIDRELAGEPREGRRWGVTSLFRDVGPGSNVAQFDLEGVAVRK
jgi:hypothetical protein